MGEGKGREIPSHLVYVDPFQPSYKSRVFFVWLQDAMTFDPERWADGRQVSQSKDPFGFQPFGAGPRICLGQQFGEFPMLVYNKTITKVTWSLILYSAYTEVSITLAKLVRAFSGVELKDSRETIKYASTMNLSVRNGLWVKFREWSGQDIVSGVSNYLQLCVWDYCSVAPSNLLSSALLMSYHD